MYNTDFVKHVSTIGAVQGDVPVLKITNLPESARPRRDNNRIVAYGEVTGHNHIVEDAKMYEDELGNLFALVEKSNSYSSPGTRSDCLRPWCISIWTERYPAG